MKRTEIERGVADLAEPIVRELGLYLIKVDFTKEGKHYFLRVYVDKRGGVTIDDCQAVAKRLNPILDETDPIEVGYIFEVSSPGAERPLVTEQDFEVSIGRLVHLTTYAPVNESKEFEGILLSKDNGVITLELGENKETIGIPEEKVAKVRLAIRF